VNINKLNKKKNSFYNYLIRNNKSKKVSLRNTRMRMEKMNTVKVNKNLNLKNNFKIKFHRLQKQPLVSKWIKKTSKTDRLQNLTIKEWKYLLKKNKLKEESKIMKLYIEIKFTIITNSNKKLLMSILKMLRFNCGQARLHQILVFILKTSFPLKFRFINFKNYRI
jgi:hypothetical protein